MSPAASNGALGDRLRQRDIESQDERQSLGTAVAGANDHLETLTAGERVRWAVATLPGRHVLSSSFGAQAAVSLHLLTQVQPDVPVILIDTGYLFPETYRFVDAMTERLDLNLQVYRSPHSAAWQEARHGRRWRGEADDLAAYHDENKVKPMRRALDDLSAQTWFAGLRRAQSESRRGRRFLERHGDRWKVHPIADWTDRDVHGYLRRHELPYHPLWHEGYVSIGDVHTTRPLHAVERPEDVRFAGFKRECGLHDADFPSPTNAGVASATTASPGSSSRR